MYVNTYILGVSEDKKEQYTKLAEQFAEIAKDFGAVEIYENWEKEVPDGKHTDYRKAINALPNEKIVVSWTVWPDRKTAERAHRGMFEDPRMTKLGEMPFDGQRMILGGFEPILTYQKKQRD